MLLPRHRLPPAGQAGARREHPARRQRGRAVRRAAALGVLGVLLLAVRSRLRRGPYPRPVPTPANYWGEYRHYADGGPPERIHAPSLAASLVGRCLGGVPAACRGRPFPVPASAPAACFPRLAFLASYPTSGNEIVHGLYEAVTGITYVVDAPWGLLPREGGPVAWVPDPRLAEHAGRRYERWVEPRPGAGGPHEGGVRLHIHDRYCRFGRTTADGSESLLPMGRGTVMKTHFPTIGSYGEDDAALAQRIAWRYEPKPPTFDVVGLARLARNPGDNLLRDAFRWDSRECEKDIACFREQARGACGRLLERAEGWNRFHAFWRDWHGRHPEVPHAVLHYEDVTDRARAAGVMRRVVALAGEAPKEEGGVEAAVAATVRPPDYVPGTLVRDVCGAEAARALHAATREAAEELGYAFDDAKAAWAVVRRDGDGN